MPLPSVPLRENQGHEPDRFAAAEPRVSRRQFPGRPMSSNSCKRFKAPIALSVI